jgi:hypothetical protein
MSQVVERGAPQELKPAYLAAASGTAEAAPSPTHLLPKPIMRQVLVVEQQGAL